MHLYLWSRRSQGECYARLKDALESTHGFFKPMPFGFPFGRIRGDRFWIQLYHDEGADFFARRVFINTDRRLGRLRGRLVAHAEGTWIEVRSRRLRNHRVYLILTILGIGAWVAFGAWSLTQAAEPMGSEARVAWIMLLSGLFLISFPLRPSVRRKLEDRVRRGDAAMLEFLQQTCEAEPVAPKVESVSS